MKFSLILLIFLLLNGCATISSSVWPENIPSKNYYIQYYQKDKPHQEALSQQQYLLWVHRFYFGWELYRRGWLQATEELAASINNANDRKIAVEKMNYIGLLISAEWAKNKQFHLISTRNLSIWGNALNYSVKNHQQLTMLETILIDVKRLLAKDISSSDILASNYHTEIPFGIDDFF